MKEEKTRRVMLCTNHQIKDFYMDEMIERVKPSGIKFKVDRQKSTLEDEEDIYIFLTPDELNKIQGLKIGGWDEMGDVYTHPNYDKVVELLELLELRVV